LTGARKKARAAIFCNPLILKEFLKVNPLFSQQITCQHLFANNRKKSLHNISKFEIIPLLRKRGFNEMGRLK